MDNDEAFVERTFLVDGTELLCRFYRPLSDGQDFSCRYEIGWPDGPRSREVWGVDSIQALLLALKAVNGELLIHQERNGVDVRWLGGRHLGLPSEDVETAASRD